MADFVQTGPFSRKSAEKIERLPGRIINFLGGLGNYLGSEKAAQDYTRLLKGRSAAAQEMSTPQRQGPIQDVYEQPGVGFFDRRSGRFLGQAPSAPTLPPPGQAPGMGVTPVVRREDDQYRQLLSQYGALQKEKKFDEATTLGREIWAKKYKDTPLTQPKTDNPLMRSMREMFPERYSQEAAFNVPQGVDVSQGFSAGVGNPVIPTQAFNQGAVMDANRGVDNLQVWQRAKTNPMNFESQTAFEPGTLEKVSAFLAPFNK